MNSWSKASSKGYQKSYELILTTRILVRWKSMVYCSKCGMLNSDDANVCVKCGAPLNSGTGSETGPYWKHRHQHEGDYHYHRGGGGIAGLVIGIIIIVVGLSFLLSDVYGVSIPWWPMVIIIVGIWLLVRAVMWRRRY